MGFRSEFKGVASPVTKYIQWKSTKKAFEYYDKESGGNVEVKLPVTFIAVDDFFGVSGGELDSSNVFHAITSGIAPHINQPIVVKRDGYEIAKGLWKDIKDDVKAQGGTYTVYTYAIMKLDGDDELVCFKLAGSGRSAWFEKEGNGDKITVKDSEEKKNGAVVYNQPIFKTEELTQAEVASLEANPLVAAFDEYSKAKKEQKDEADTDDEVEQEVAPGPDLTPPVQAEPEEEDVFASDPEGAKEGAKLSDVPM